MFFALLVVYMLKVLNFRRTRIGVSYVAGPPNARLSTLNTALEDQSQWYQIVQASLGLNFGYAAGPKIE